MKVEIIMITQKKMIPLKTWVNKINNNYNNNILKIIIKVKKIFYL